MITAFILSLPVIWSILFIISVSLEFKFYEPGPHRILQGVIIVLIPIIMLTQFFQAVRIIRGDVNCREAHERN